MQRPCHENKHWRGFSPANASQNEGKPGYVKPNTPMPCPPRGTVPVNPQAWFRGFISPQHARFAFGEGCDRTNDVGASFPE